MGKMTHFFYLPGPLQQKIITQHREYTAIKHHRNIAHVQCTVGETVKQNHGCDFMNEILEVILCPMHGKIIQQKVTTAVAIRSLKARLTSRFHSPMRPCESLGCVFTLFHSMSRTFTAWLMMFLLLTSDLGSIMHCHATLQATQSCQKA